MINIIHYKWAGSWGPFKIKIPCGECSVTESIVKDVIEKDFVNHKNLIKFEIKNWLENWWRLILKGGYHAPIITINGNITSQGAAIDRGLLGSEIRKVLLNNIQEPASDCVIYSKTGCKYCLQAKEYLREKGINYVERDIINDPIATAEIFKFTKKYIGNKTPVTTPQIWIDGKYIGGYENLIQKY